MSNRVLSHPVFALICQQTHFEVDMPTLDACHGRCHCAVSESLPRPNSSFTRRHAKCILKASAGETRHDHDKTHKYHSAIQMLLSLALLRLIPFDPQSSDCLKQFPFLRRITIAGITVQMPYEIPVTGFMPGACPYLGSFFLWQLLLVIWAVTSAVWPTRGVTTTMGFLLSICLLL